MKKKGKVFISLFGLVGLIMLNISFGMKSNDDDLQSINLQMLTAQAGIRVECDDTNDILCGSFDGQYYDGPKVVTEY